MIVKARHSLQEPGGLVTAVASAAAFGPSGTFATSLLRAGWTPAAAVAVRLLIASMALTVPAIRRMRAHPGAVRRGWHTIALYGLIPVAGGQLCYFEAVQHLSVAVALVLEYSGTILVVAWMWARHHQVPTRTTVVGGSAAIAGVALALGLAGNHRLSPLGVLWGLGAAVCLATYFVVSARESDEHMPSLLMAWGGLSLGAFSILAVGAAGLLPLGASGTSTVLAHAKVSVAVPLVGIGLLSGAFAYVTGIAAARLLGARTASFVGLAEVAFAAVYASMLLGEQLTSTQMLGGALVVGGIALVRLGEPDRPTAGGAGPAVGSPVAPTGEAEALRAA